MQILIQHKEVWTYPQKLKLQEYILVLEDNFKIKKTINWIEVKNEYVDLIKEIIEILSVSQCY